VRRLAVPALNDALRDKFNAVRIAAATALGQIGEAAKPALPVLLQTLKDPDPEVAGRGRRRPWASSAATPRPSCPRWLPP